MARIKRRVLVRVLLPQEVIEAVRNMSLVERRSIESIIEDAIRMLLRSQLPGSAHRPSTG